MINDLRFKKFFLHKSLFIILFLCATLWALWQDFVTHIEWRQRGTAVKL
jgi:hypothetical protein